MISTRHGRPAPSSRPVWELEADERLLDPGPGDLGGRYDLVVVGGGVVGLTTAALCGRAGLGRVAVLERGRLAAGPSGRGGGILAPALHHGSDPASLVGFAAASLALWKALDREWDGALGVQPIDILQTLPAGAPAASAGAVASQPPARALAGLAPQPPPGAELLDPGRARDLEPRLAPGTGGVLLRGQARVHPLRLAVALARRAGTVATGVEVTGIEGASPRGVRLRTSRGEVHAGAVVLATGGAPAIGGVPPAGDAPEPVGGAPRRPGRRGRDLLVKGVLVATVPAPFRLRVGVGGRGGLAGQLPDGRLLFGNTFDPTDRSPAVRPETLAATLADLAALLPDAAGLPLAHAWSCFRPATATALPVIDRVDGLDRVWATYGHFRTGFLLAAATGQALATWISGGGRPDQVAPFRAAATPQP
jgi:glycine/D-amino acid oxidase-like deaminating enzyme